MDGNKQDEKSFVEHLDDLRLALMRAAFFLAGGMIIAVPLAPFTVRMLKVPYEKAALETELMITQVGGGLAILINTVLWSGLLLSLPLIIAAGAIFVFPGLTRREQSLILQGGSASVILFAMGVGMAWRWTVPVALRLMTHIEAWMGTPAAFWDTAGYVSFVLKLLLAFGMAFQFPLILLILGRLGLITPRQLSEKRRHFIVALLAFSMIMTPPDPLTMVMMAVPLYLLYEICILLLRGWSRTQS